MLIHAGISSVPTLWIAHFNSVGTIANVLALLMTIVVIAAAARMTPKSQSSSFAWGIQNATEWPDGVSVLMSFLSIIWTMSGFDSSFHLVEETSNAGVVAPRSIVMTAAS